MLSYWNVILVASKRSIFVTHVGIGSMGQCPVCRQWEEWLTNDLMPCKFSLAPHSGPNCLGRSTQKIRAPLVMGTFFPVKLKGCFLSSSRFKRIRPSYPWLTMCWIPTASTSALILTWHTPCSVCPTPALISWRWASWRGWEIQHLIWHNVWIQCFCPEMPKKSLEDSGGFLEAGQSYFVLQTFN